MVIIYYQIAIPVTLIITYLLSNKSKKVITIVGCIWGVWTLVNVPYPPLNYFQFANIIISYLLITKIFTNFKIKDQEIKVEKYKNFEAEKRISKLQKEYGIKLKDAHEKQRIRFIEDHETHVKTLNDALENSYDKIIILSGWATDRVVDLSFKKQVLDALKRGVQIYIGYGYESKIDKKISRKEQKNAEQAFTELQSWCAKHKPEGKLNIYNFPNHSKLLISDNKYMVCGSFNWLSNSGFSKNIELSIGIINEKTINYKSDQVIEYLNDLPPNRRDFQKIFPLSDY